MIHAPSTAALAPGRRIALLVVPLALLLAPGLSAHEDSYMFVWSDQAEVAGTDSPPDTFSWNALDAPNSIEGLGTGRYRVHFGGYPSDWFGAFTSGRQVGAYGTSNDYCLIDEVNTLTVACFDASGSPKNSPFLASMLGSNLSSHTMEYAAVAALEPTNPSYNPTGWNAGTGSGITVTRSGVGSYSVAFAGFASVGTGGGNVQVTADSDPVFGPANRCVVASWATETVNVRCFDPAGAAADTGFFVVFQRAAADLQGIAFAWADQESSASYTPNPAYSLNPTGGAVAAQRSSPGVYSLTWAGMGGVGLGGGHVQVTAYGTSDDRCKVASWFGDTVFVRCFDTAGNPVDTRYSAIYRKPIHELLTRHFAAASVLNPEAAQSTPTSSLKWNPMYVGDHPDAAIVTRLGPGHHEVQFTRMDQVGEDGGHAQVSVRAFSLSGPYCKVEGWFVDTVTVRCFDNAGSASDEPFDVFYFKASQGEQVGYVWADQPATASYTPPALYSRNPSGGGVQIDRLATGHYRATFDGIGLVGTDEGLPIVSAYGTGPEQCQLLSWNGDIVDVLCFSPGGGAADSRFALAWLKPDANMDGFAYAYADLEGTSSYAPVAAKAHNPAGKPITATRNATGEYQMEWQDYREHGFGRSFPISSTVGTALAHCQNSSSSGETSSQCYDTADARVDTEYAVVHLRPIPLPEPDGLARWGAVGLGLWTALCRRRCSGARPEERSRHAPH